jgi:hypothetical protein
VNDLPGDTVDRPQGRACRGGIDAVSPLGDDRFVRVAGWIDPGGDANARSGIAIVDAAGSHVGHAVVGPALQRGSSSRPFAGYLLRGSATDVARFVHLPSGCSFSGPLRPRLAPFRLLPTLATLHRINVTADQVVDNHDWTGSDFERTQWPDLRVLGSWRTGDADVASVTLQLRRGDVFFYRTGPGRGGQTFAVTSPEGGQLFGGELPPSNPWRGLLFDNEWLPERFLLTLRDDGRGWGQWAAIGVRETASRP